MFSSTIRGLVLSTFVFCASASSSLGAIIVGNTPLPIPSGGIYPVHVEFSGDFTSDADGLSTTGNGNTLPLGLPGGKGFIYDGTTHEFQVGNLAVPHLVKQVWFRMEYTVGLELPQSSGDPFDPTLWPTLTAAEGANAMVTGASAFFDDFSFNSIYMTWLINPQPAWETIALDFPALGNDFQGVFLVEVKTACDEPVPEPSTLAVWSLLGLIGVGLGWRRSR